MADDVSKSWFCVFPNPHDHGYLGEPAKIVDRLIDEWIEGFPTRTCAVNYCISAEGLHHCHAVFEDVKAMRFSVVKKTFPSMHIEPTKGNKEQAEDYINKRGKWDEKGEVILYSNRHGEIKGSQGQRRDLSIIEDLLADGKTPNEIMSMSLSYRRYEKMVRDAYYQKRASETPILRDVKVYWHVGLSGSGKSYSLVELAKKHGEDNLYLVNDYDHGFDKYNGEPIIFLDEFRGQMSFPKFLTLLDGYKSQVPCRYSNVFALWNEIHITSVLPPEYLYQEMVKSNRHLDSFQQMFRRIDFMFYHYRVDEEYKVFELPMSQYTNYEDLRLLAENTGGVDVSTDEFVQSVFASMGDD